MKIEKLNDNQIKCTLTKADLESRNLKLHELAYGTEKTKRLFRDMIQQADFEYGFDTENVPLMIEAIPMKGETIILIITKVDDPEELDTRFSKFAPSISDLLENQSDEDTADFGEILADAIAAPKRPSLNEVLTTDTDAPADISAMFVAESMQKIMTAANAVSNFSGESMLYKDLKTSEYLLLIKKGESEVKDFYKACSAISEYCTGSGISGAGDSFISEHCEVLISEDAIGKLKL